MEGVFDSAQAVQLPARKTRRVRPEHQIQKITEEPVTGEKSSEPGGQPHSQQKNKPTFAP